MKRRGAFRSLSILVSLFTVLTYARGACALPRQMDDPVDPENSGGICVYGVCSARTYLKSLPLGTEVAGHQVLSGAYGMPMVQQSVQQFLSRGYIRRQDLDNAVSKQAYSCAVLCFEKPGTPVTDQQPVIVVITKPLPATGPDGSQQVVLATQLFGGMLADSAGTIVGRDTPGDPSFVVTAVGSPDGASVQPDIDSEVLEYKYAGYSLASNGAPDPYSALWTAIPDVWQNFIICVSVAYVGGFIKGGPVGAAISAVTVGTIYWFPNPLH